MPSYSLHQLAITQDSNCSMEDGVDDDHPTNPLMHPCYRQPINAKKMRRKPKGPPHPQQNKINNSEVGSTSVHGSPGSSPQDQWQDVHHKQKCDHLAVLDSGHVKVAEGPRQGIGEQSSYVSPWRLDPRLVMPRPSTSLHRIALSNCYVNLLY